MKRAIADVAAFHNAARQPVRITPKVPDLERKLLRIKLIHEEVGETISALFADDLVEIADGIADSIVVLIGTALEYGIPLDRVWAEVHRANMTKFPICIACEGCGERYEDHDGVGPAETVGCPYCEGTGLILILREDGKVLKPKGWTTPDIAGVLRAAGWEEGR